MKPGDAFLGMPSYDGTMHMCVVLALSETSYGDPTVIVANLTSMVGGADKTCVVTPHDVDAHPFVRRECYVYYRKMQEMDVGSVANAQMLAPVCSTLLSRMPRGVLASPCARPHFKKTVGKLLESIPQTP